MKFQIIIPPIRDEYSNVPPYGALHVGRALCDNGHHVSLINADVERPGTEEILGRIEDFDPDIIGFTSIVSTSYKFIKDVSIKIKERFSEKKIVLGGHLSPVHETLLKATGIDIVIEGEGEIPIVELFDAIENNTSLAAVPSLRFKEEGGIVATDLAEPIRDLNQQKYPLFEMLDMDKYLLDANSSPTYRDDFSWHDDFELIYGEFPHVFCVVFTRGCVKQCAFCHRHYKGFRSPSPTYILDYLEYLQKTYRIGFFYFPNELTAPSRRSHLRFIEEIRKRRENGFRFLFSIGGALMETIDSEVLHGYSNVGAVKVEFGYESGSQKILDIMEKRVTVEKNLYAARIAKECKLYSRGNTVLGLPGETVDTVLETADFLDRAQLLPSIAYVQALPGSPIYRYAQLKKLIVDEDDYLTSLSEVNADSTDHYINYTDSNYLEVIQWGRFLRTVLKYRKVKRKYGVIGGILFLFLMSCVFVLNPGRKLLLIMLNGPRTKEKLRYCRDQILSSPFFIALLVVKGVAGELDLVEGPRVKEKGESLRKIISCLENGGLAK